MCRYLKHGKLLLALIGAYTYKTYRFWQDTAEILGVNFLACLGLVFTLILAPELESLGDFLELDLLILDLSGWIISANYA